MLRQYLGYGDVARGWVSAGQGARGIYSSGREEPDVDTTLAVDWELSQGETVRASDQLCETTDC